MEGLNDILRTTHRHGWICGFNVAQNHEERVEVTHLQYVDNTLIFSDAEDGQLR